MHFLAATTTRAVSANVAADTTPSTRKTLAVTFVARPDAATVQLATISVRHLLPHLVLPQLSRVVDRFFLRAVAVHALTVFALFVECANFLSHTAVHVI